VFWQWRAKRARQEDQQRKERTELLNARLAKAKGALPPVADLERLFELLASLDYPNAPSDQERIAILEEALRVAGQDSYALALVRSYLPV
jgi:hypothetical protein